jgi:uncharacterized protein
MVKKIIVEASLFYDQIEFIWHGGEPCLAGLGFFEQVIEFQKLFCKKNTVFNTIQTNGTLITEEWIQFFKNNEFKVGVSIDGPRFINDKYRHDKNFRGYYDIIIDNINKLDQGNVLSGVICCITNFAAKEPKEIFKWIIDNNIKHIKFLPVFGFVKGKLADYAVDPHDYYNFLYSVTVAWLESENVGIEIQNIKDVICGMCGDFTKSSCEMSGRCFEYFTIYPNGKVCACDSIKFSKKLFFGRIEDGFENILASNNFVDFKKRNHFLRKRCSSCKWFRLCKGGCFQGYYSPCIFREKSVNFFCEAYFEYLERTNDLLKTKYNLKTKY